MNDFRSVFKCASPNELELSEIENKFELDRDISDEHPEVTKYERKGWYLYAFCSESFSSAAITLFIPIILQDLAFRAGSQTMGGTLPCIQKTDTTEASPCFVYFLGMYISPDSFALYVQAISVVIQLLTFISLGAFADYSNKRKSFLTFFTVLGSLMCIMFLFILNPSSYPFAAVLTIIANVCFGSAMIFFNAYLPLLVNAEPEVKQLKAKVEKFLEKAHRENRNSLHEVQKESIAELNKLKDRITSETSSYGMIYGYLGGFSAVAVLGVFLYAAKNYVKDTIYLSQVCVALVGFWWTILFLLTTFKRLHVRPGPPFPTTGLNILILGWKSTASTFVSISKLKNAFLYLMSWFFYADSLNTIASVAVIYGKSQVNMTVPQLFLISLIGPFFAIFGNFVFLKFFYKRLKWSSKTILIFLISILTLLPAYGLLGFVVPSSVGFGLNTLWEMYILGSVYGFLLGAICSFSRTLFSELIPPGMESEMFALYEITDKGSSWLGPVLVGVMTDRFGNIRYAFFVLVLFLLISLPFLCFVNSEKGKEEAKNFKKN